MKDAIASAITILLRAKKDWVPRARDGASAETKKKVHESRNKARKEIRKAIGILQEALKQNKGSGEDKNP